MILQLLPPGTGGVRDFAEGLGEEWRAQGLPSRCVEGHHAGPGELAASLACAAAGSPLRLVVHFSGYGYAPRGLCHWLVDELERVRAAAGPADRLLVVFHELFTRDEPPWRTGFWLSPIQRRIAHRLAALAHACWTNTGQHGRWLALRHGPGDPPSIQPVFSNVGEPGPAPGWEHRRRAAVVFGSQATRLRALEALRGREASLRAWGIEELVHVGTGPEVQVPLSVPQHHLGRLEGPELSAQLHASRFALLDYPAPYLGKSGVYAAYAAHGCTAIDTHRRNRPADGLEEGRHYLALHRAERPRADVAAAIGDAAWQWYRPHARARQAAAMRELLQAR